MKIALMLITFMTATSAFATTRIYDGVADTSFSGRCQVMVSYQNDQMTGFKISGPGVLKEIVSEQGFSRAQDQASMELDFYSNFNKYRFSISESFFGEDTYLKSSTEIDEPGVSSKVEIVLSKNKAHKMIGASAKRSVKVLGALTLKSEELICRNLRLKRAID